MNNIQFSVVIPLYNKRSSIINTLNSVKNQHHAAQEIVVIDDGSSDGGLDLVKALKWPELTIISQKNAGVSTARNNGVKASRNEYVAFLDADDHWSPHFLGQMQRLITRFTGYGLYASRYQIQVAEGKFKDPKIRLSQLNPDGYQMHDYLSIAARGNLPFMVSSSVVNKAFFEQVGGFPQNEWMGEDQSFFIEAALSNNIIYTPQILVFYHLDSDNRACEKAPPTEPCAFAQRLLEMTQKADFCQETKKHANRYCAAHICDLAKRNVRAGYLKEARVLLSNDVCQFKVMHKLYWLTFCWSKTLILQVKTFLRFCNTSTKFLV